MDISTLTPIARRQMGLITRDQAEQAGWPRRAWYRALAAKRLEPVHPRVARLPGAVPSQHQSILAAVLAVGPGSMASHRSAAFLWTAEPGRDRFVDVTSKRGRRPVGLAGVTIHQPRDRVDLQPIRWRGIDCTNPLRTLVDLGAVDPGAVAPTLTRLAIAGFVSPQAVRAVLERHARPGRDGIRPLRQALDDWAFDHRPPDSELEIAMKRLVDEANLPTPVFHARVLGWEVDFLFVESGVVVECDGWETHGRDRDQFERDRQRDAEMVGAGYAVLRFTWRQVVRRHRWVADRVQTTVSHRLGSVSGRES